MEALADVASERGTLAGICRYGKDAYLDCADLIQPQHFTSSTNQSLASVLYSILQTDLECKIDLHKIFSVAKDLGLQGQICEGGNAQYVDRILSYNVELSNVRDFAKRIRTLAETRHLTGILSDTAKKLKECTGKETLAEIVALAENPIMDYTSIMTGKDNQIKSISDGLDEYLDDLLNNPKEIIGIPVGYPKYEQSVGYIESGLHIIAARPGCGKSTIALNIGLHASIKSKVHILYLDTELSLEDGQWNRALARISGVDFNLIRRGSLDEVAERKVRKAARLLNTAMFDYINISMLEFESAMSFVRRWLVQKVGLNSEGKVNPCMIIYDYIKLTDFSMLQNAREYEIIGARISHLHDLSMKYKVPIIGLIQLSRIMEVSQSDRCLWYATSLSHLEDKSVEEIAEDGPEGGNKKLYVKKSRFGSGIGEQNYINLMLNGRVSTITELLTRDELAAQRRQNGTAEE